MSRVKKAVIPAAGLGTRFLPATKAQPKEMLPILDKPTIQYIVEEAVESGVEDILIITGRGKRAIEDHFDRAVELEEALKEKGKDELLEKVKHASDIDIHYIRQKEPLGLGHAILCAKKFINDEPFGILLGDDIVKNKNGTPCLKQMIDIYQEKNASVIGVQEVPMEEVSRYGIVSDNGKTSNGAFEVKELIEKPPVEKTPSRLAIMGRYVVSPRIFTYLENTGFGSGGEIQLTDALNDLAGKEQVLAYPFEGTRYDAGDLLGYLKTTVEFALEREDIKEEFREYLKSRL